MMKFIQVLIVFLSIIVIQTIGARWKEDELENIEKTINTDEEIADLKRELNVIKIGVKRMSEESKRKMADLEARNKVLEHDIYLLQIEDVKSNKEIAAQEVKISAATVEREKNFKTVSKDITGIDQSITGLTSRTAEVNAKVVELGTKFTAEIPTLEKGLSDVNKQVVKLTTKYTEIPTLQKAVSEVNAKVVELGTKFTAEIPTLEKGVSDVKKQVVKLTTKYTEIPTLQKTVSEVSKDITGIDQSITELTSRTAPVDGGFSAWGGYSSCNVTCGSGMQVRTRSCDSPAAQHGGKGCSAVGHAQQWKVCNTHVKCPELPNLAIGKTASQSSTLPDGLSKAGNADDGDLSTTSYTNTAVAWWRVDLEKSASIQKVRLYPDGHSFSHVETTSVSIGNDVNSADMTSCGVFTSEAVKQRREGQYAYDVICKTALEGRYIQVNKKSDNGDYLSIREFEAYGKFI